MFVVLTSLVLVCLLVAGSAVLTDPGPLCSGQPVLLTCNITGGVDLIWSYNSVVIGGQISPTRPPPTGPVSVGGVQFTLTLLLARPDMVSKISFTATAAD